MRTKSLLYLLLLLGLTSLNAQTYYKIIFSGEPDSILVENLTKGTSLSMQGTDTLSLKLSGVGVQEMSGTKRTLIIYPNPMDHSCRFDFENTTYGRVEIQLFNANGKKLHDFNARLSAGIHQFELSGVPAGVYHLQIKTESYRMSGSFVSTYESALAIRLIHKMETPFMLTDGNNHKNQKLTREDVKLSFRSIMEMDFETGDQLKFTGYKTNSDDDIEYASPTGDQTIAFTFCVRPGQPSVIAGNDNPCHGTTHNYSVTNVSGVTYTWSVPSGWNITNGQGTNSITVTAGTTSGNIIVTPSNTCGNGTARTLAVTPQLVPEQPSAISGNINPCQGATGVIYSVTNVPGVTYFWLVPDGWTITNGQNTNSITVTAGSAWGDISVTPSNDCGDGTSLTLSVTTQTVPDQPSPITGNDSPCQGISGLIYSVIDVPGVDYWWTVPPGWIITSGQNTNSITVTAGSAPGNITVTPSNTCGNGPQQNLVVTAQSVPAKPTTGTHEATQTQIVWNWNPAEGATGYKFNTKNNIITTTDNGTSTTYTQTGLICDTTYTLYVWAYNDCGNSLFLSLTQNTAACTPDCGSPVTFTYNGSEVTYGTVTSANNRCWLDRNLGAVRVATSSTDTDSYGDLFQWGRLDDGHQVRTSPTTATLSSNNDPGHSKFILGPTSNPFDWRSPQNPDLWQGVNGINNPCPEGFRVPTRAEWDTEIVSWTTNSAAGAFASPIKLPMAGSRNPVDGSVYNEGSSGTYWSSTLNGISSWYLNFSSDAFMFYIYRAYGQSVRCIKDCPVPEIPSEATHVPSQTQIVWNWNNVSGAMGYKYNTDNNYATATDNGTSTTWTQIGLTCNTAYTLYVWAYNECGPSASVQLTQSTTSCTSGCGGDITFTYNGSTVTYGTVTSANNKCWLDRNLGATQVATSSTDASAYGDLFQRGRLDDGHQVRTSPTTTTLSNSDVPGHGNFILAPNNPYDWRSPQNDDLWQGEGGTNNPCPDGYRLPTQAEWNAERISWSTNNAAGAFASPLKLPSAGRRYYYPGSLGNVGTLGYYWSSTVNDVDAWYLFFNSPAAGMGSHHRANGYSVRCLKD